VKLVAAMLGLAVGLTAQSVRILHLPDNLVLPARSGANVLIEVAVEGKADSVWLATAADSTTRVPLVAGDAGRYQLNLADVRVTRLVIGTKETTISVYAAFGSDVKSSAAIRFARLALAATAFTLHMVPIGGGTTVELDRTNPLWLAPGQCERLEVRCSAAVPMLSARMGSTDVPLTHDADSTTWRLVCNAELRRSWLDAGSLQLVAQTGGDAATWAAIDAIPKTLRPEQVPESFTLAERTSMPLPGSGDWLELSVPDIHLGEVELAIRSKDGKTILDDQHLFAHEHVTIDLGGPRWELVVQRVEIHLRHPDRVTFCLVPQAKYPSDRLQVLFDRMSAAPAGIVFQPGGGLEKLGADRLDGKSMARLLRVRRAGMPVDPQPEAFVEGVTGPKSIYAEAKVQTADGATQTFHDWLLAELAATKPKSAQDH
jgi:hypothetical protein